MNRRLSNFLVSLLIVGLASPLASAQTKPASAVATVNGVAIPQALLDQNVRVNIAQGQRDTPELRQAIRDELVNREVLAQESARLGLDKTADAQTQWAQVRQTFMVEILLNDYARRNPITEDALKAEFDRQIVAMKDEQQYRVSLIVTATEPEAKAILARLKKGEAFTKLASELSIDPSKKNAGEVGWVVAAQILPAISNVMVNLTKGSLSVAPIQTPAGWNIIKLEDKRAFVAPSYDLAKNDIRQMLLQKQRFDYVKTLRDKAKVVQ
ncbi:peptidylprolyl isomerase [Alcaligenaceae bacterium LF4-65]|jgi:peptidyl-prolyl cis-trans isomerase C|uniref:peptidylprolyl isomerase n=1 Tax=Zwartia hollandica TaxID=324606 RepID=A0A953N8G4_9BURK|nr:peptidylprolyl isomerase [Zwartia hollandica]MBZ1350837.1 peptidylprolyl isomerase [Zwartia hollandica]